MMMMRAKVNQWVEGTTINQDAYNHWESQLSILCTVSCLVKIDDNKGWVLPACSNHEGDYQSYEDELIMASFSLFSYRLCGNETSEWYHGCSYRTEVWPCSKALLNNLFHFLQCFVGTLKQFLCGRARQVPLHVTTFSNYSRIGHSNVNSSKRDGNQGNHDQAFSC